jgi:polar amino acid transport system permease protein
MKDSSLVLWIGVIELLRSAQIVITRTQEPLFVLGIAGAIYFLLSFPIARIGEWLERRWREQ